MVRWGWPAASEIVTTFSIWGRLNVKDASTSVIMTSVAFGWGYPALRLQWHLLT